MKATELSRYRRDRFNKNRKCTICGKLISDTDELFYEVHKFGHWRKYYFTHWGCLNATAEKESREVKR